MTGWRCIYGYRYLTVACTAIYVSYGDTICASGIYTYGTGRLGRGPVPVYSITAIFGQRDIIAGTDLGAGIGAYVAAGLVIYRYLYITVASAAIDVGYGDAVGATGAYIYGLCGLSGSPQPAYGIAAILGEGDIVARTDLGGR